MAQHDTREVDALTGVATTGHEWDGIRELNNPLPRWWLWVFYATIVWSVGYWVVYPSWPLISTYAGGVLGWHSRTAVEQDLAALRARRGATAEKIATTPLADIVKTPELLAFARAQGKTVFADNCAPCHGAGGAGARGYPNLNDDEWLWGGTLEAIQETIRAGIRSTHPDTRTSQMPAFGRDNLLPRADILAAADYVRSLAKLPAAPDADLVKGQKVYAENCASCHGDTGTGNRELGAPNLTDAIWLYGSDRASVIESIVTGRGGVMPNWAGRLDDTTVKALTVYVHSLGGGE